MCWHKKLSGVVHSLGYVYIAHSGVIALFFFHNRVTAMLFRRDVDHVRIATADETALAKTTLGTSWREEEEHIIPDNRLGIVFCGILGAISMVVLDSNMISTALPTIVTHLGDADKYSWIGSAYLLGSSTLGPSYGKWSDTFGRKAILFVSIAIFLVGSTLCGVAQTMTWLIVSRAIQGLGGGGVTHMAIIVMSDIIPLDGRGPYIGCLGATVGISSIVGPIIGGVITQHLSWRWCFFIHLPIGGVAGIVLFIFLKLNPRPSQPIRRSLAEFDFSGLIILAFGNICLLMGLSFAQQSWSDVKTIILIAAGVILLIAGIINEMYTRCSPILPPRLFKTRTTVIILISGFIDGLANSGSSYLSLYYQILGDSATEAGVRTLSNSIGHASSSIMSGIMIWYMRAYRPTLWGAWILVTVGWGLMIAFNKSSIAVQAGVSFVAALGSGGLSQPHLIAVQASMPLNDMATSSSAIAFLISLGAASGTTLWVAIISSVLPARLAAIPNFDSAHIGNSLGSVIQAVNKIPLIPDLTLRKAIRDAFSRSICVVWIVLLALSGFGFIFSLFVRGHSLKRKIVRGGDERVCVEKVMDPLAAPEEKGVFSVEVEAARDE